MKLNRILAAVVLAASTIFGAQAQSSLGNLLGGLGNAIGNASDKSGSSDGKSGLGDVLGEVLGGLISSDDVNPKSMVGTWSYNGPAVCFKSDNFLQKAGGAAAAGVVEGKLEPYYNKLHLNQLQLTVNEDLTFVMQSGKLRASGVIEKAENGDIIFNFQVLKAINIGKVQAYVTMTGKNSMSLMFDVSKLVTIIKTVSSVTGSSSISAITKLLESYDGICAGFKLSKQK